jgi:hypothetical protein
MGLGQLQLAAEGHQQEAVGWRHRGRCCATTRWHTQPGRHHQHPAPAPTTPPHHPSAHHTITSPPKRPAPTQTPSKPPVPPPAPHHHSSTHHTSTATSTHTTTPIPPPAPSKRPPNHHQPTQTPSKPPVPAPSSSPSVGEAVVDVVGEGVQGAHGGLLLGRVAAGACRLRGVWRGRAVGIGVVISTTPP